MSKRIEHQIIDGIEMKWCGSCQQWKPLECFGKRSNKWDGLRTDCKECHNKEARQSYNDHQDQRRETMRIYYYNHKEQMNSYAVQYHREHREYQQRGNENRRARSLSVPGQITKDVIQEKLELYNYCCMYCGQPLNGDYHIEHILPLSRGGTNEADNIGIACPHCNMSKGNKTYEEYMEFLEKGEKE